ncbi:MAG: hypothetical protein WCA23_28500 [Stellaceae bacterium]
MAELKRIIAAMALDARTAQAEIARLKFIGACGAAGGGKTAGLILEPLRQVFAT